MIGKKINAYVIARAMYFRPKNRNALRNDILLLILFSLFVSSCSTSTPPPQVVPVFSSLAAEPWLSGLYDCAAKQNNVVLSRAHDSNSAEIVLQIGEPTVTSFAYQIDKENIVVVMNDVRPPVVNLQQIKGIFTGQITNLIQITSGWGNVHSGESGDVHVWVYSSDSDVQRIFNKLVLEDRPVLSSAKLAVSPQNMLAVIRDDRSSVGILPQHWNSNHEVFEQAIVATVPVLALTNVEPQGVVKALIACLQK